jgi:hypothetical protein
MPANVSHSVCARFAESADSHFHGEQANQHVVSIPMRHICAVENFLFRQGWHPLFLVNPYRLVNKRQDLSIAHQHCARMGGNANGEIKYSFLDSKMSHGSECTQKARWDHDQAKRQSQVHQSADPIFR